MKKILPKHIAIIMDGNGRWARNQGLPTIEGHVKGTEIAKEIVKHASALGIKYLTLYTFSSENWRRPQEEVEGIMSLLKHHLINDGDLIIDNKIKLKVIGDINALSQDLRDTIMKFEALTKDNNGMELIIALSYGARAEIISAVKKLISMSKQENLSSQDITEAIFAKQLYTAEVPDPDLLIRTGKEVRVSNFLLWQIAYTELYFSNMLWPEFSTEYLDEAINEFRMRERRYGQ